MNVSLDKNLWDSFHTIIQYQNNLLIKNIAEDNNWDLKKLKKYIKQKTSKEKLVPKPTLLTTVIPVTSEESEGEIKILKKKVIVKRKRKKIIKKIVKEQDLEVDLEPDELLLKQIEFLGEKYYINHHTNYVYKEIENGNIEFVGILEDNKINFDAESTEE